MGPAAVLRGQLRPALCSREPGNVILFPFIFPVGRRAAWAGGPGVVFRMRLPLSSIRGDTSPRAVWTRFPRAGPAQTDGCVCVCARVDAPSVLSVS